MAEKTTWIKIDRNILHWRWFTDRNTLQVFLWLLLNANIKPNGFMGVTVKRGEVATSYKTIASQSKMTVDQARTAIHHLKITGEVTITRHSKFLVISIVNYDLYQGQNPIKSQSNPIQIPITSQSNPNNQRIKERKKERIYTRAREGNDETEPSADDRSWEAELGVPSDLRGCFESKEAWVEFYRAQT